MAAPPRRNNLNPDDDDDVARPAYIKGDWKDDRTPAAELYFPPLPTVQATRRDARAAPAAGDVLFGHKTESPITYGNREKEVTDFLRSKEKADHPLPRMEQRILPITQRTFQETLVDIIDTFHFLAVTTVDEAIANHQSSFSISGYRSTKR